MRTIVKNGMIVTETDVFSSDILIENGSISQIGKGFSESNAKVIDAAGKYVLPGAVDVHTHMDLQSGQHRAVDDFFTGTVAAACGGTTTIVDHIAFGPAGCSLYHQIEEYHRLADNKAVIDYGFHGVIQHVDSEILHQMSELAQREGVTSFKVYMTYNFKVSDSDFYRILTQAKKDGIVIAVHCENDSIINYLRSYYKEHGMTSPMYHPMSRPNNCEAEAVSRAIHIAAMAGCAPLYIVHLSCTESLAEVHKAKSQKQKGLGVETCPQYLTLTDKLYTDPNEGLKAIMSPPLRTDSDREALWNGICEGDIDTIATDHCPFNYGVEKQFGRNDFTSCPNGAPCVEERVNVIYSEGVAKGKISISDMVRLLCAEPSRIFGLYPKKGVIQPGSDGDIVIFNPKCRHIITQKELHSAVDYTCYEGLEVQGAVELVMQRGKVIVKDNRFLGAKGDGQYLKRKKSCLAL